MKHHIKSKKIFIIMSVVIVLAIITPIIIKFYKQSDMYTYSLAKKEFNNGNYLEAINLYSSISDYDDSKEKAKEATYLLAQNIQNEKDYSKAIELYTSILNYKDAGTKRNQTIIDYIIYQTNNGDYLNAFKLFASHKNDIPTNETLENSINQCISEGYDQLLDEAKTLYTNEKITESQYYFEKLDTYKTTDITKEYLTYFAFWKEIEGEWHDFDYNYTALTVSPCSVTVHHKLNNIKEQLYIPEGTYNAKLEIDNGNFEPHLDGTPSYHMNFRLILDDQYVLTFSGQNSDPTKSEGRVIIGYDTSHGENVFAREEYVADSYYYKQFGKNNHSNNSSVETKKDPAIGMTATEVEASSWGKPYDINKTTYAWGTTEQWCYSGYRYIYFENGLVIAISE